MINKDRIVPITKCDLLSMYGTVLNLGCYVTGNTAPSVLEADNVEGNFVVTGTGSAGSYIANQPVKTLDFAAGVTGAEIWFVPAYDYKGFTINGVDVVPTGAVNPDGVTLYQATFADGAVTITAFSPEQA